MTFQLFFFTLRIIPYRRPIEARCINPRIGIAFRQDILPDGATNPFLHFERQVALSVGNHNALF